LNQAKPSPAPHQFNQQTKEREMKIPFKKLHPDAQMPTKGSEGAAGYDLYANEDAVVPSEYGVANQNWNPIKTGISISIPKGHYGRIAPRSGLAVKYGINVLAGVVDSDYRGELGVVLHNSHPISDFMVRKGDRIAQLIIERCYDAEFVEFDKLEETERGQGGFGSTGMSNLQPLLEAK
jgi:dUTP pyrophosphatase